MQMNRHSKPGNVLEDHHELGGVEQPVRDIRKDLKSTESQLPGAAVDLRNRPLRVAKPNAAERDKFVWIVSNDSRQIVIDAQKLT